MINITFCGVECEQDVDEGSPGVVSDQSEPTRVTAEGSDVLPEPAQSGLYVA